MEMFGMDARALLAGEKNRKMFFMRLE